MTEGVKVQRRSLCTWTSMAAGFRAFYAVVIDGGQLYGSTWLALLAGIILYLPVAGAMIAFRRWGLDAASVGAWWKRGIALILSVVLIYDAGAVIGLMSGTAKYVAMPEANRIAMHAVTAVAAVMAIRLGAPAAAGAAVLWKRLAAALIVLLVLAQWREFTGAWVAPILGPGVREIGKNAMPAAGVFAFSVMGFVMIEKEQDPKGAAVPKSVISGGLIAAALALCFCMLVPGIIDEPPTRSFRIGRLLANDRAGLTLEMPYVVLLYSGMMTMLIFELTASVRAMGMVCGRIDEKSGAYLAGAAALVLSLNGWTERDMLRTISMWYYPLIGAPVFLMGFIAWLAGIRVKPKGGCA